MQKSHDAYQKCYERLRREQQEIAEQLTEVHSERGKLQNELKVSANYMNDLEARVYDANKTALGLLKQVRDLESENATLKNYIVDLKARVAVYVPVKDDPID